MSRCMYLVIKRLERGSGGAGEREGGRTGGRTAGLSKHEKFMDNSE